MMADALSFLKLRCLGPPSVRLDDRDPPADVVWRKHLALLVYLALSPDTTRARSHLIGLLWAESPEDKARRSLNEAVRRLRAALGEARLLTRGEALQLTDQALEIDVKEFESQCRDGQLRALELLRGDFLEGFHVDDAPAFDAWMDAERSRIRDAATQLLIAKGEEQLAVNRTIEARALARRALTSNPFSEPAVSLGMRGAALDGDASGALALFHDFSERLQREIGEKPSAVLQALAARLRAGTWQRQQPHRTDGDAPLIGRRDQHARLFSSLEGLAGDGACCFAITGEAGSGRTRLLAASAERLALQGVLVASAAILESDHDAPWSTLRALMRGGLLQAPGIAGTDHLGLRVLASLVPELSSRLEPLEARDVAQVSAALASLFRAVADEQPVGLLIDDAQWADGATLAALRAVLTGLRDVPLALVFTVEADADHSTELQALVREVGRSIPGAQIGLEPLASNDVAALTEALAPWCTEAGERDRLARRVALESGGNPFLAVTLLRDLGRAAAGGDGSEWPPEGATYDSTLPIRIPAVVRNAIAGRVARLDPDSIAVLRAASVAADIVDARIVADVSGLPPERVEAALDRLESERFVVFEGGRYAFSGRLLPKVIESECTQPGGRRRIRDRYITALATRDDLDAQFLRARLLAVERRGDAVDALVTVAERALTLGARRTAHSAIRTAERLAGTSEARRGQLEALRQRVAGP
jgi:DNA-binding SARP family transcriptional activator